MDRVLNYILFTSGPPITLDIFEAERYAPAVVVQQLVGNLIYYSNFGRYEPRIAESWERPDAYTWQFKIRDGFKCDNGELIDSGSFKKNLEISILLHGRRGDIPVLSHLVGYREFLDGNRNNNISEISPLKGIVSEGNHLTFRFEKKIKSGPLQILSFAPFGYICRENFDEQGNWRDKSKFVSSGPYRLEKVDIGKEYILQKSGYWMDFTESAPDKIIFSHDINKIRHEKATIVDVFASHYSNERLRAYKLVPEYLNAVVLGNLKNGYFRERTNREIFGCAFNKAADEFFEQSKEIVGRSKYFYPGEGTFDICNNLESEKIALPQNPLLIEGKEPERGSRREMPWKILRDTFKRLGLKYKFANNDPSYKELSNPSYDIRMVAPSIGGGAEAWGLFVLFCSPIGINLPDPGNRICDLINSYETSDLGEYEFSKRFAKIVNEESAILPINHFGVQLYLTEHINLKSLSPLISIIRIDQLEVGD